MSTRAFTASFSISKKAQKNLVESNTPIGRTRLMQMMTPSSSGAYGMMYENVPTWDIQRVPRQYASLMSSF